MCTLTKSAQAYEKSEILPFSKKCCIPYRVKVCFEKIVHKVTTTKVKKERVSRKIWLPSPEAFQHDRQLFMLEDTIETRQLRRKQVLLCEYPEGYIKVFYNNKELRYRMLYDRVARLPQGTIVTDNKYLTEVLEYAKKRSAELKQIKRSRSAPRKNHLKISA